MVEQYKIGFGVLKCRTEGAGGFLISNILQYIIVFVLNNI